MTGKYSAPEALTSEHVCADFASGQPTLDAWLTDKAQRNERSGASRTYVTCVAGERVVVGFSSLAASSVRPVDASGPVRRNMPDPVPVILLGRLAVDGRHQGIGLGASLLQDAVLRIAGAARVVGVRVLLVHAIDAGAAAFSRRFGFQPASFDESTLFLPMTAISSSLKAAIDD